MAGRKKIVMKFNINGNKCIRCYESATDAAESVGGQASHITECCNNRPHRHSHMGYKWRYLNNGRSN